MANSSGARLLVFMLAALTAWSLLVLALAWGGLGGRFGLHPEDAGRIEAVPEVALSSNAAGMPDMDGYVGIAQRPLFNSDRLPFVGESSEDEDAVVEEEVLMPLDATLTGVIKIGEDTAIALIKGNKSGESQNVKVGDNLQGDLSIYKLVELEARKAVFDGPRGRSELELETFTGRGAKPPTAVQAPLSTDAEAMDGREEQESEVAADDSPEAKAEMIRRRIEERRRQMREEAERARSEQDR
ncbi:MAG: hypothetical protein R3F22_09875 [Lysobacteraceae bacterium]